MTYLDSIILGLIQGLTEFLPISSSGHLVLGQYLLGVKAPGVMFELVVHFGTLMSVLIYFRKKVFTLVKSVYTPSLRMERLLVFYIILGTIPAVIIGLTFKGPIERAFASPWIAAVFLIFTGIVLLLTSPFDKGIKRINVTRSIIVGFAQALAILPGISRSGMTIAAALFSGVKPMEAAEYSFLLSIPVIIGAIVYQANNIIAVENGLLGHYIVGAAIAFLTGLFAVYILLDLIKKGKFKYFGIYCLVVGMAGVIYFI